MKEKSAFKAGIGYTAANILVKGIGFFTLPVFSHIMTTEEFGIYNVFVSYESILFVLAGFAMHASIQSANMEFKGEIDRYTSSISLIYVVNVFVMLGICFFFGDWLAGWMGFGKPAVYLLIIYSFSSAVFALYNSRISLEYAYRRYLAVAFANSAGNVCLSIFLIFTVFSEKREYGRIAGSTIILFVIAVTLLIVFYKKSRPSYCGKYWNFALRYSIPIVPHGISQVLLAQSDRIMIQKFVGDSAAGIYSLAGNINLILAVITDSIATAWRTWFYREMSNGSTKKIQTCATRISALFMIFVVGLMAVSPEMIRVLGGSKYCLGQFAAIPMAAGGFILFLYNIVVQSEYYSGKTIYVMAGTACAAGINVIANYIFIQQFGYLSAAYTTLFSYMCYLALHLVVSYRLVHFCVVPVKWLLCFLGIVIAEAAIDVLAIQSAAVRWGTCVLVAVPTAVYLARVSGGKLLSHSPIE